MKRYLCHVLALVWRVSAFACQTHLPRAKTLVIYKAFFLHAQLTVLLGESLFGGRHPTLSHFEIAQHAGPRTVPVTLGSTEEMLARID